MRHLVKVSNPEFFRTMKDFMVQQDQPADAYADYLANLCRYSKQIFACYALVEDGDVVGFVIGILPNDVAFSFMLNAWVRPGTSKESSQLLFNALKQWSFANKRYEIRAETMRSVEALERAWGFEEHSVIIKYKLKEPSNGGQQQTTDDVDVDGDSTEGEQTDRLTDSGWARDSTADV